MIVRDDFSVDPYLSARYVDDRYECRHFVRDIWKDITGEDIADRLGSIFDPSARSIPVSEVKAFRKLDGPESPCIVLLRRSGDRPHMGVFLRRRVLHLDEAGAHFDRLDIVCNGFDSASFYQ